MIMEERKTLCFQLLLTVILILMAIGCRQQSYRDNVPAIPSMLDTLYDTYEERQVLKVRRIFRKGITYRYRAVYTNQQGEVISDNFAEITPLGERWEYQPERQDVVAIKLGFTEEEKARILANPINKTIDLEGRWMEETREGVIENTKEVWMHPIRHNQYIFTEVAAFPEVRFPLEVRKEWRSGLGGLGGWGDWDGMDILSDYKITGKEKIKLKIGPIECWVVETVSTFGLGTSTATFHFHEDLGFVRMNYTNYLGQGLIFELEEVAEI